MILAEEEELPVLGTQKSEAMHGVPTSLASTISDASELDLSAELSDGRPSTASEALKTVLAALSRCSKLRNQYPQRLCPDVASSSIWWLRLLSAKLSAEISCLTSAAAVTRLQG